MEIKQFVFNPFGVNCYILSNSKGEAILIDPSASNAHEQAALTDYIKSENLKVVRVLNTHLHLDHVLGNAFAERTFGIKAEAHKDDEFLLGLQKEQAQMFGLPCNDIAPALGNNLNEGDIVKIAEIKLQVILLELCQKIVVLQCTLRQHDADNFFKGTGPRAADTGKHAHKDVFFIETLNLQIIETLCAVFTGEELDVLLNDGFILLINSQIHTEK